MDIAQLQKIIMFRNTFKPSSKILNATALSWNQKTFVSDKLNIINQLKSAVY